MENEIVIHNETDLQSKIYTIREMKVMLDFDLAEIYGYSVKAFNRQVKNNIDKFDEDFRFQLTKDEYHSILRCKNCTLENQDVILRSKKSTLEIEAGNQSILRSKILTLEQGKYSKYLPYAFTEQGIYMLMTVLKGDLATRQSKILIRLFKGMKDFIIDSGNLIGQNEGAKLAFQTSQNTKDIAIIKETMVTKAELTDFMKLFDTGIRNEEILILDGEPFKADFAYQKIYGTAEKSIIVIDDYLGLKTLHHLAGAKNGVQITIISDNKGKNPLKLTEYNDFLKEYPNVKINFIVSLGRIHDRYIALDFGTKNERLYHCGASSKDAGHRITTILEIKGIADYKTTLESLLSNRELKLKL